MRFGKILRNTQYGPWQSYYLDYTKLKRLLREDELDDIDRAFSNGDQARQWTEEDESTFVEELLNIQLEKVNAFHVDMLKQLRERASDCETCLERHAASAEGDVDYKDKEKDSELLSSVEGELDKYAQ